MVSIYELAFSKIYGVGFRVGNEILKHLTPEELFTSSRTSLEALFGGRTRTINDILNKTMFAQCERELDFIIKNNVRSTFLTHEDYPTRLKNIPDAPFCLFVAGRGNLNANRMVAVVGSRNNTEYGRQMTETIVEELQKLNAVVVSGLAYGIDAISHRAALNRNIPTFGVLGHGLDTIYPKDNWELSQQMQETGGLVTECFTNTMITRFNFPQRNRIIAGLCDVVVVVEAAKKGGALLTARLANDYNREVVAVPGRFGDEYSEGCNFLIESNRAHILSSVKAIAKLMDWNERVTEVSLFTNEENISKGNELKGPKHKIYKTLKIKGEMDIDSLSVELSMGVNDLSAFLLELELEDYVMAKPGRVYKAL